MILASTIWSLEPAVVSRFRANIKPITYTLLRAIAALSVLLPSSYLLGVRFEAPGPQCLLITFVSAMLGPGLGDTSYAKAIQLIGGSPAVILSYTYIFVAQALAVFFLGELMKITLVLGSTMAFLGIIIATRGRELRKGVTFSGIVYSSVASLSWATAITLIKVALIDVDPLTFITIRIAFVAAAFLPASIVVDRRYVRKNTKEMVYASAINGVLGWGLGLYIFTHVINVVGVSVATIATALTPVISQITVKVISKERPTVNNVIGALMIFAGLVTSVL